MGIEANNNKKLSDKELLDESIIEIHKLYDAIEVLLDRISETYRSGHRAGLSHEQIEKELHPVLRGTPNQIIKRILEPLDNNLPKELRWRNE